MAGEIRDRIIEKSWELFRDKGFGETTINDIIREAEISKGTFYYYFMSKDNLLDTLSEILDHEYQRLAAEEPEDMDAFEKLMWLNQEMHQFIKHNIDYKLMSYLYSAQIVKDAGFSLLDKNRFYFTYVQRIIEEGVANGELTDKIPISEMVRFFSIGERALVTEWCMNNGNFDLGEYSSNIFPMFMSCLKK
ncbi:MAG: TetR/AcrR family transcriptional regulator [Mogibacterium sp.]|nr:TetR/AcrR family transcriptional regulator [Mogibacterium sp.]